MLRKALWHQGIRYKKNYSKIPGTPDIAITKYNIAIFCDSEFFHGKDWNQLKSRLLKGDNGAFWVNKISNNRAHDEKVNKELSQLGWTVIRFWGKDITKNVNECVRVIEDTILEVKVNSYFL